jgi:ubiquinone/menaquinone biosynthesis C-methylase UbiE
MISFQPESKLIDSSYDRVAGMYADVFTDIKVREDEWNWLKKHFPKNKKPVVLDIGCGNGALLRELSPNMEKGIGVDASEQIIKVARERQSEIRNASFEIIHGPKLPIEDQSVDVVISLLSFRYLDWDPLMDEIKRVLRPGGKVLIIDMITVPVKWQEYPDLVISKFKHYLQRKKYKSFYYHLTKLVNDPSWKEMLKYNPIRAEHEMKWYLESRFPGKKVEKINIGWNSSVLAFDSGNIENIKEIHLTYP